MTLDKPDIIWELVLLSKSKATISVVVDTMRHGGLQGTVNARRENNIYFVSHFTVTRTCHVVRQANKQIKNNQTKHPGVITLDHQSLRSGVIFGSGSGVRAREGEVIRRI